MHEHTRVTTDLTTGLATDLADRREQLARLVRLAPRFVDALRWWAGFELQGEQTAPTTVVELADHDAPLLDLPMGTRVTRRDIYLVATMVGPSFLAGAVTELVYEPALGMDLTGRRALHVGSEPTDRLIGNLHRAVWVVQRPSTDPRPDNIALQARTILTGAGRPVAVTTETVYWRLLTHRAPDATPHFAAYRPTLLRTSS